MYAILYSQSGRKTAQTRRERIMDFVKERNFIVAYENGTYQAKWDILTGHYYGKSGKAVHGTPHAFIYDNLAQTWQKQVSGYVRFYREWFQNDMRTHYTQKRGARYEQLISLWLRPSRIRDLDSSTKLTKDLVNYLVENNNGVYSSDKVNLYLKKKQYGKNRPRFVKILQRGRRFYRLFFCMVLCFFHPEAFLYNFAVPCGTMSTTSLLSVLFSMGG